MPSDVPPMHSAVKKTKAPALETKLAPPVIESEPTSVTSGHVNGELYNLISQTSPESPMSVRKDSMPFHM